MKVHLIRKETIESFSRQNARSRTSFVEWLSKIKYADWGKPADMQSTFGTADLLGKSLNRVVFDIGDKQVHLFVCRIGTHAEYDELCNKGEQYTMNNY